MATIDDKYLIKTLIENDGHYQDDPQAYTIWSYVNDYEKETYAVFWNDRNDMRLSPHVHQPRLLWQKHSGTTLSGKKFLASFKQEALKK